MSVIDISHLRQWIGREERQTDIVTPGLVERFQATLGASAFRSADGAPLAIHWCLAPPARLAEELGPDGHPTRGGFLPPVPLPRRMWAGGRLEFHHPVPVGVEVTRTSRIADVFHKAGRSGELVFVAIDHMIESNGVVAITERQDIVFRPAGKLGPSYAEQPAVPLNRMPLDPVRHADHVEYVEAATTLLFRYSALTFNGHRIHYDVEYAREVESYPGLVVHGPLQATLMLHMAARFDAGRAPSIFSYRGVAPLFHGDTFSVNAVRTGNGLELWCADANGVVTMNATAENKRPD